MAIWFHKEDSLFELKEKNRHRRWLRAVAGDQGYAIRTLNIIIASEEEIVRINSSYLNHNYPTDVITFDLSAGKSISGDMYIGIDQVRRNSDEFGTLLEQEIRRVMVHGLLHLMGMDDHTAEEIRQMRKMENEALTLWAKLERDGEGI